MKISTILMLVAAAGTIGCARNDEGDFRVRIAPSIRSRATELGFENGDRIGLSIVLPNETYAENTPMTYDGTNFSSPDLVWYGDRQQHSTLKAYFPYSEAGVPDTFHVAPDQTTGTAPSDLLGAVKADVVPGTAPVGMLFYHLMSQLTIRIDNRTAAQVTGVEVDGTITEAAVDFEAGTAAAATGAQTGQIAAYAATAGSVYRVVLVPQTASITVTVSTDDGKRMEKSCPAATFESGRRYDLSVVLEEATIEAVLSGEISDWIDGGPIGGNAQTLEYEGETYRTAVIGSDVWMIDNLRYRPVGVNLGAGLWMPVGGESAVATQGMLYDRATAVGEAVVAAGEPVRGICPPGWHIPDTDELSRLAATESGDDFYCCAGYWIPVSGGKYSSPGKGYLLGSTLQAGKAVCLSYTSPSTSAPSLAPLTPDYGVSLRCVKDAQ